MAMRSTAKIIEAYTALGLEDGASLEIVKSVYKQIALRTHPDKNPGNPSATAEFQRVSEAYRILVSHLSNSSDEDEWSYDEDDIDGMRDDIDIFFHLFMYQRFESLFGSGFGRPSFRQDTRFRKPPTRNETREGYQERVRRSREAQVAAQERRKAEIAAMKERRAKEQEERLNAEARQKAKIENKKAQAILQRTKAEQKSRNLREQTQKLRSSVFASARSGDAEKVKKGIWENGIDAAGGEVRPGCEEFVKSLPKDNLETLLHIAAWRGDLDLLQWLDSHNAEMDERDSEGFSAFHVALKHGQIPIVSHILENYSPKDSDSASIYSLAGSSLLFLALESWEPELVWMILDRQLANTQEINATWTTATSDKYLERSKNSAEAAGKLDDIIKLLKLFGGFTPPSTPRSSAQERHQIPQPAQPVPLQKHKLSCSANGAGDEMEHKQPNFRRGGRGRGRGCGRGAVAAHSGR